jgi:transcriptional regulator of acetoin/glycerol metabolism
LVAAGQFRADLLFRLRGLSVVLPPLRTREDVEKLAHRLLSSQACKTHGALELDADALAFIAGYSWPGNVRELKQVLDTAACLCESQILGAGDLRAALGESGDGSDTVNASGAEVLPMPRDERSALLLSLKRNRWNVSKTAHELKAARTTIYRRMSRLGIVQPHLLA